MKSIIYALSIKDVLTEGITVRGHGNYKLKSVLLLAGQGADAAS